MCKGDLSFDEARRQAQMKRKRHRKKLTESTPASRFSDMYRLTGEILGEGACASVQTARNINTDVEVAVKIIDKYPGYPRSRVFKEIDTFHHCKNHPNIIQLIEYVEEEERFYLVFEKVQGGKCYYFFLFSFVLCVFDVFRFSLRAICGIVGGAYHIRGKWDNLVL